MGRARARALADEAARQAAPPAERALDQTELFAARNLLTGDSTADTQNNSDLQHAHRVLASTAATTQERAAATALRNTTHRLASAKRLRDELAALAEHCQQQDDATLSKLPTLDTPHEHIDLRPAWQTATRITQIVKKAK